MIGDRRVTSPDFLISDGGVGRYRWTGVTAGISISCESANGRVAALRGWGCLNRIDQSYWPLRL